MKVALVHDWLTGMRGGERCLEALCELFPDAPIYTLFHVKGSVSRTIERHPIIPSFLNRVPFAKSRYRYLLPFFPSAIQRLEIHQYDLVVSSSHCVAKGIRVPRETCHISYVHTPMRYIWDGFDTYFGNTGMWSFGRLGMGLFRRRLQRWDVESNAHVSCFIANSQNVAGRIARQYGRAACVVYPPVDWQNFHVSHRHEGFYLMVTAFAPYKKVDLAIAAANELGLPLKIIGQGQDEKRLRRMAGQSVEFLGWQSDHRVRDFYSRCLAVLFPGEEDFGIVPLEAMASGKPVIAYGKGGALETIVPLNPLPEQGENHLERGVHESGSSSVPTGVFHYEQSVQAIVEAIQLFTQNLTDFNPYAIRAHVEPFDRSHFKQRIQQVIMSRYRDFRRTPPC
ncbi:glycosyltransferase [Nitrospira sp. T9]|uniref:glycosyltransferase n=1 Tax=unclassified Nitrospira TaxID=2652172 RepID=UPI003F9AC978